MDQRDKEQLVKIICYGVAIVIAYNLLIWLFKYVVTGLQSWASVTSSTNTRRTIGGGETNRSTPTKGNSQ